MSTETSDAQSAAATGLSATERAKVAKLKKAQRAAAGSDPAKAARDQAQQRAADARAKREARAKARAAQAEIAEQARAEKARLAQEKAEKQAAEKVRVERERAEQAAREAEVTEQARAEALAQEAAAVEAEAVADDTAADQVEADVAAQRQAEKDRAEQARLERDRVEKERLEQQKADDAKTAATTAKKQSARAKKATLPKIMASVHETVPLGDYDFDDDDLQVRERVRRQMVRDAVQPAADAPTAVKMKGLVKEFADGRGVHGIDLEIPAGGIYGIVGPNGAGKSTLISMLAGLQKPDAGTIEIAGHDLESDTRAAKAALGVLPDRLRTFDRLTGRQLLRYVGQLRGLSPQVIDKRSRELARAFDLESAMGRVIADYSSGMTKKLLLAAALLHAPKVLVLDEPFEAVDPASAEVILGILRVYVQGGGTVVLSTHGMDLIERVCANVAIINQGHVLAEGDVEALRGDQSLESKFVELIDYSGDGEGLEWLYASSS